MAEKASTDEHGTSELKHVKDRQVVEVDLSVKCRLM